MRRVVLAAIVMFATLLAARSSPETTFAAAEVARIRSHFDSAEREVRGHPATGLSAEQRTARLRALDRVHAYAQRGVFPHNRDFPGKLVPYFVDTRTGTRCGMAYLIEESGAGDFVARIAGTNNNATIPDLKDDPELIAWLERNGLTLDEAARIQPKYQNPAPTPVPDGEASAGYKTSTIVAVSADVATVALNGFARGGASPTAAGAMGLVTGAVSIAIGAPNLDESGSLKTLGWVNVGAGVVSAALGTYRLTHKTSSGAQLSIGPWFRSHGDPGFRARVAF